MMTDKELHQYAGKWIEATLVDGRTVMGRLLVDEPHILLTGPFEIEQPPASPDAPPPRIGVDALNIVSVRALEAPPETLD